MSRRVPTSAFETLRSKLDPESVADSEREQNSTGTVSLLVLRANEEIHSTLADFVGLGISGHKIAALVNRELLHQIRETGRGVEQISTSDRLVAIRRVARRIERAGLRRYGSKWKDRARPGDFQLQ